VVKSAIFFRHRHRHRHPRRHRHRLGTTTMATTVTATTMTMTTIPTPAVAEASTKLVRGEGQEDSWPSPRFADRSLGPFIDPINGYLWTRRRFAHHSHTAGRTVPECGPSCSSRVRSSGGHLTLRQGNASEKHKLSGDAQRGWQFLNLARCWRRADCTTTVS
jgi:hypothetical protein